MFTREQWRGRPASRATSKQALEHLDLQAVLPCVRHKSCLIPPLLLAVSQAASLPCSSLKRTRVSHVSLFCWYWWDLWVTAKYRAVLVARCSGPEERLPRPLQEPSSASSCLLQPMHRLTRRQHKRWWFLSDLEKVGGGLWGKPENNQQSVLPSWLGPGAAAFLWAGTACENSWANNTSWWVFEVIW